MAIDYRTENGTTTISSLVSNILDNTSHLVRQEMNLVKAEVKTQVSEAIGSKGKGVALLAGAGVMALIGLAFLGITLIFVLQQLVGLSLWLSALIITLLYFALGGLLAFLGQRYLKSDPVTNEGAV